MPPVSITGPVLFSNTVQVRIPLGYSYPYPTVPQIHVLEYKSTVVHVGIVLHYCYYWYYSNGFKQWNHSIYKGIKTSFGALVHWTFSYFQFTGAQTPNFGFAKLFPFLLMSEKSIRIRNYAKIVFCSTLLQNIDIDITFVSHVNKTTPPPLHWYPVIR